MRYSLTNRVQGTLVGALFGQSLATAEAKEAYCWSKVAARGIESLIARGEFDFDEWNQLQSPMLKEIGSCNLMLANAILATLPIALFFHDNHIKLRENLILAVKSHNHPLIRDGVLAVGYIIAQSFNEKINLSTIITEITTFIGRATSDLPEKLQQVNNLIVENSGYSKLQNYLAKENNISNTIAAAFYCFATSREDFQLTCLRAIQNKHDSIACGAIAGAISGAYNAIGGIPIAWHLELDEAKLALWGLTNFSQMVELADALVAVWSGAYTLPKFKRIKEVQNRDLNFSLNEAIAAPNIIRLR